MQYTVGLNLDPHLGTKPPKPPTPNPALLSQHKRSKPKIPRNTLGLKKQPTTKENPKPIHASILRTLGGYSVLKRGGGWITQGSLILPTTSLRFLKLP